MKNRKRETCTSGEIPLRAGSPKVYRPPATVAIGVRVARVLDGPRAGEDIPPSFCLPKGRDTRPGVKPAVPDDPK
jgi:hypothetical protein